HPSATSRSLSPNPLAPPHLHPLSLHDALPISSTARRPASIRSRATAGPSATCTTRAFARRLRRSPASTVHSSLILRGSSRKQPRSEEHTSELQSRSDLVCRLLLEKKTTTQHMS